MKFPTRFLIPILFLLDPGMVLADAESQYNDACSACHGFGVAGAPRPGIKQDWENRAQKPLQQLYENAINGFTGEVGVMPAKGGFSYLSDDDVRAIVDYMLSTLE